MEVTHEKEAGWRQGLTVSWRTHGSYCCLFPRHSTCALAAVLESYQGGRSRAAVRLLTQCLFFWKTIGLVAGQPFPSHRKGNISVSISEPSWLRREHLTLHPYTWILVQHGETSPGWNMSRNIAAIMCRAKALGSSYKAATVEFEGKDLRAASGSTT